MPNQAKVSRWRAYAAPIIEKVLSETRGQDEKIIRKALTDAYPFGQRSMHPYAIWLNEIARQRGKVKAKPLPVDTSLSLF